MGFFRSTKGSIISDSFKLLDDLGQFQKGWMLDIALYDDYLTIGFPKNHITLNYSQISDVYYGIDTEIAEKNKSVIGRAIVGGVILGGLGAVVGAISGTGKKQKKKKHFTFIISYTSKSGETEFLQFEDTRLYKGLKVSNKLKELCNIDNTITEL